MYMYLYAYSIITTEIQETDLPSDEDITQLILHVLQSLYQLLPPGSRTPDDIVNVTMGGAIFFYRTSHGVTSCNKIL